MANRSTCLFTSAAAFGSAFLVATTLAGAASAPGAPGSKSHWGPGDKTFLGTARSAASRVWFTGYRGIVSEIAFGSVTQRQFNDMGFFVAGTDANGVPFVDDEKEQIFTIERPDSRSLRWRVTTTPAEPSHGWRIVKEIVADPDSDALLINTTFTVAQNRTPAQYRLYFFANPSISNSGGGDGQTEGNDDCFRVTPAGGGADVLVARENSQSDYEANNPDERALVTAAVAISGPGWERRTIRGVERPVVSCTYFGPFGSEDGLLDIKDNGQLNRLYDNAMNGNVLQVAQVRTSHVMLTSSMTFNIAVGFAAGNNGAATTAAVNTAVAAAAKTYGGVRAKFDEQWIGYLSNKTSVLPFNDPQLNLAVLSIKASEDKQYPGAIVAGLSVPWGDTRSDWVDDKVNERTYGGYMLVWPRDMAQKALGLMAAGDNETALAILKFLFNRMMQTTSENPSNCHDGKWCPGLRIPGRFPQNAWLPEPGQQLVDEYWSGTQQDETAFPIILAQMLHDTGDPAIQAEVKALWPRIKLAADYLVSEDNPAGNTTLDQPPYTHQERWEEVGGLSPSSMAAQVAGLVSAHHLVSLYGDAPAKSDAIRYRRKADLWRNHAVRWMFTTTSPYKAPGLPGVDGSHYLRVTSEPDGNAGAKQSFANFLDDLDERDIVDAGFLEFVRFGVMSPTDWSIQASIPEVDHVLRQDFPTSLDPQAKVPTFFRYNGDVYGNDNFGNGQSGTNKDGRGRLWPIFTAERGLFEIARARATGAADPGPYGQPHRDLLRDIGQKAYATGFIPEQVWSKDVTGAQPGFMLAGTSWATLSSMSGKTPLDPTTSSSPLNWAMGSLLQLRRAIADDAVKVPNVVCKRYACASDMSAVTFSIDVPKTIDGEMIYLVGGRKDGSEVGAGLLGNWEPPTAVPMNTSNGIEWSVTVSLPRGTAYEFKFVKTSFQRPEDPGFATFQWEPGQNRTVNVPNAATHSWSDQVNPVTEWDDEVKSLN